MPRDYKIRMAVEVPEATSANVSAWIEEALKDGTTLKADPGAGPETIALRLDAEKVVALANKKHERVPVMLRRLIATRCNLPAAEPKEKSAGAIAADALPDKVLPRKLQYEPEDFLKIVRGMDRGLAMAYRRIYRLTELAAAQTPEEDRDLATAMAECANRRAPKWMVENADLVKLTFELIHWTSAQTEDLEKRATEQREPRLSKLRTVNSKTEPAREQPPAAASPIDALLESMTEPVQGEGEF